MNTMDGNLRENRRVNFRDTAMGSKGPDGNVRDSNHHQKKNYGDTLETVLGEQRPKEDELLHAEVQRLRAAASSASTISPWVEVGKAASTPKRGTDPRAVRLQAARQEINQRHQGDRYQVEIRQVFEGQDSNTQANVLAALAPMELHEKLAVVEVLGSMPMSLKTSLLMQGNDMSLWDRIAMFYGWAKRHQRGLDVVQELHERPGIAGLPVLDWMPHHDPPAPGQLGGDRAGIHDHLRGDRASTHASLIFLEGRFYKLKIEKLKFKAGSAKFELLAKSS
eukprot:s1211_g24.t1